MESHATVAPLIVTSRHSITLITPRDRDIFAALDRCPLTVRQLLALSETFAYPFTSERRAQERLAKLRAAGRVRRWLYSTAGPGVVSYFTLTPEGYRILRGHDAPLPHSHAFGPVAVGRQHHTHALADFIVHTAVAAQRAGIAWQDFYRENTLALRVGAEQFYPDCAFQLRLPDHPPFQFFVELDNSTERVHSEKEIDSWDRKIRLYEAYANQADQRFRVLVVTTRSRERLDHILSTAAEMARNVSRSLVYGVALSSYLAQPDALHTPCFFNHRNEPVALLPQLAISLPEANNFALAHKLPRA